MDRLRSGMRHNRDPGLSRTTPPGTSQLQSWAQMIIPLRAHIAIPEKANSNSGGGQPVTSPTAGLQSWLQPECEPARSLTATFGGARLPRHWATKCNQPVGLDGASEKTETAFIPPVCTPLCQFLHVWRNNSTFNKWETIKEGAS